MYFLFFNLSLEQPRRGFFTSMQQLRKKWHNLHNLSRDSLLLSLHNLTCKFCIISGFYMAPYQKACVNTVHVHVEWANLYLHWFAGCVCQ